MTCTAGDHMVALGMVLSEKIEPAHEQNFGPPLTYPRYRSIPSAPFRGMMDRSRVFESNVIKE
jgi:hypothetical protein